MLGDESVPRFGREFFDAADTFTRIGDGELGGKAACLDLARRLIVQAVDPETCPGLQLCVPTLTVLTTEVFSEFIARNHLDDLDFSALSDHRIAHAFQLAELPARFVGDLRALISRVHTPLAVRSSSLLEDALAHPFAGVYGTKMIPNNQHDVDTRFRRLTEAVKFVFATTFFRGARDYRLGIGKTDADEKMAVIVQEVVGRRHDQRFYPDISGVGRSYSYYPTGGAASGDGVVDLALGLGKQIVDGGLCWIYCPARPAAPPPFNSLGDRLRNSQREFWAVNMGRPPLPDPIRETEYLLRGGLEDAKADGSLRLTCSTYDPRSDRLRPGPMGDGPHVLDFAPVLVDRMVPLNNGLKALLAKAREVLDAEVEIEFAVDLEADDGQEARLGFLQVRPMAVADEEVEIDPDLMDGPGVLLATDTVLGNGVRDGIRDVVYVRPEAFEAKYTVRIAGQIEQMNRRLHEEGRPYLLIGFGRWGSSDPWLGIPVDWSQIGAATVIVEATLPEMNPDLSQGSHFFHNMISFRVLFLSVRHGGDRSIDWSWLDAQDAFSETDFVRHVRLESPLRVSVDGRGGRGVVTHGA